MATSLKKNKLQGDFTGAIFNVGRFMSPVQKMKDRRGKCIFYGSLPQETGGLTPMIVLTKYVKLQGQGNRVKNNGTHGKVLSLGSLKTCEISKI